MIVNQGFRLGLCLGLFPSSRGDTLEHPQLRLCKGPWNEATSKAHPMGCALEWSFRLLRFCRFQLGRLKNSDCAEFDVERKLLDRRRRGKSSRRVVPSRRRDVNPFLCSNPVGHPSGNAALRQPGTAADSRKAVVRPRFASVSEKRCSRCPFCPAGRPKRPVRRALFTSDRAKRSSDRPFCSVISENFPSICEIFSNGSPPSTSRAPFFPNAPPSWKLYP